MSDGASERGLSVDAVVAAALVDTGAEAAELRNALTAVLAALPPTEDDTPADRLLRKRLTAAVAALSPSSDPAETGEREELGAALRAVVEAIDEGDDGPGDRRIRARVMAAADLLDPPARSRPRDPLGWPSAPEPSSTAPEAEVTRRRVSPPGAGSGREEARCQRASS